MSGPFRDSIGDLTSEVIRLSVDLMQLWREHNFGAPLTVEELRELVADAIAFRKPLRDVIREAAANADAKPAKQPAPKSANALIEQHHLKVGLVRQLFDHAAQGGHYRHQHRVLWQTAEEAGSGALYKAETDEYCRRWTAAEDALNACMAEKLVEPFRVGIRVTDVGRAWLANCDRDWLNARTDAS
jgi:hypothetical protein